MTQPTESQAALLRLIFETRAARYLQQIGQEMQGREAEVTATVNAVSGILADNTESRAEAYGVLGSVIGAGLAQAPAGERVALLAAISDVALTAAKVIDKRRQREAAGEEVCEVCGGDHATEDHDDYDFDLVNPADVPQD